MPVRDVVNWMAGLTTRRGAWIALALTGLALEVSALVFQYGLQLRPCVLCIYIRLAVLGLVAAGLVGAIAPGKLIFRLLGFVLWAGAAVEGLLLSRELIVIQAADPYSFEATCSFMPKFPAWLPLHEWMPAFFMPTGSCTDDVWRWLGLSMAEWLQGVFIAYLVVLAAVAAAVLSARRARATPA